MENKLDFLAFGAHPDDVELGCSGALLKATDNGKKAGIIDLTRGELGTRGSSEIRSKETKAASKVLGIGIRENLEFKDGFFKNGIELAINEKDTKRLRTFLNLEMNNIQSRHIAGQELFLYMASYAPAFGMLGTVSVSYTHLTLPTNREV